MRSTQTSGSFSRNAQLIQHSKSSGNIHHQIQLTAARRHAIQLTNLSSPQPILVSYPMQQFNLGVPHFPMGNSTPNGVEMIVSILHYATRSIKNFIFFKGCSKEEVCF